MQLVDLQERFVVIELDPEDCYLLAKTCAHAVSTDMDWSNNRTLELLVAFFEVSALAAGIHSHITGDVPLSIAALREGRVIDPLVRKAEA